ncbi:hypothetical protein ACMFMG_004333 [Clarireedia jacksonii]
MVFSWDFYSLSSSLVFVTSIYDHKLNSIKYFVSWKMIYLLIAEEHSMDSIALVPVVPVVYGSSFDITESAVIYGNSLWTAVGFSSESSIDPTPESSLKSIPSTSTSYLSTVTAPPQPSSTTASNLTQAATNSAMTAHSTERSTANKAMIAVAVTLSIFSLSCLLLALYFYKRGRRRSNPKTTLPTINRQGTLPPELEEDRGPGLQEIKRDKRLSRHELGGKEIGTHVGWLRLKFTGEEDSLTSLEGKIMASELPARDEHQ